MKKDDEQGAAEKARGFFREVAAEARKTSWPNREELTQSTMVVIVSISLLALFVGLSDMLLGKIIGLITTAGAG